MTAFRYLRGVPYRRSYNHNGRFYALHDPDRYDRHGLWRWNDVFFSVDGSLRGAALRLAREAEQGATHADLQQILRVRMHNTLLDLVRSGEVVRERLDGVYVYLDPDPARRAEQIAHRDARKALDVPGAVEVPDALVIEVLLVLIRYPGCAPADVVRRLQGRSPPVALVQVEGVFTRYNLGEKGGPLIR